MSSAPVSAPRRRRIAWWFCLLLLLGSPATLLPHMVSGSEIVRMRNAMLIDADLGPGFDWQPPQVPAGFLAETGPKDPRFVALADRLGLANKADDWERAVTIGRHLLGNNPTVGGALKANLNDTYRGIVVDGAGYCADFVRVFNAIALAADIPVRSWAFSFDGFGGHGHVFPEIWNRQQKRWQLLDVFDNYYFVDGTDEPLSAMQFRQALVNRSSGLALRLIEPTARPGYEIEAKAWDYFRRGAPEWYLWWGNNVFSYDGAALVKLLSPVSRALEQFGGMAQGVHPRLRILPDPTNADQRRAMHALRTKLAWVAAAMALGGVGVLLLVWQGRRRSS